MAEYLRVQNSGEEGEVGLTGALCRCLKFLDGVASFSPPGAPAPARLQRLHGSDDDDAFSRRLPYTKVHVKSSRAVVVYPGTVRVV